MISPNHSWSSSRYDDVSPSPSPRSSRASSIDNAQADASDALDVFQSIYNGRKSWKTLRGGEMVWPAELEAALIEGLEKYTPDDSRETRLLGRFPMRNRFISEYIFRKTGRRRTAKQVGSRLQQLRETCTGKRLMDLLSPCRKQAPAPLNRAAFNSYCDSASSNGSASVPITPTDDASPYSIAADGSGSSRQVICIDILPPGAASEPSTTHGSNSPAHLSTAFSEVTRLFEHARDIRAINPTLAFLSRTEINADSQFSIYSEGVLVLKEHSTLLLSDERPHGTDGGLLYKTSIPYWDAISESFDPTKFEIYQEIVTGQTCIYSAKYTFAYPARAATFSTCTSALPDSTFDFSFEDLHHCFGADTQKTYNYAPFDNGAWNVRSDRSLQPVHAGQSFDMSESSSGSISPVSGAFPTAEDFADSMGGAFQGNFDMM